MGDSTTKTIAKSIVSCISANVLGLIFEFLLLFAFAWLMDFGLFWFLTIGVLPLYIITIVPIGGSILLSRLFNNRIAAGVFGVIVSIWLIVTTVEFWIFLSEASLSEAGSFKAIIITLTMIPNIVGLLINAFVQEV